MQSSPRTTSRSSTEGGLMSCQVTPQLFKNFCLHFKKKKKKCRKNKNKNNKKKKTQHFYSFFFFFQWFFFSVSLEPPKEVKHHPSSIDLVVMNDLIRQAKEKSNMVWYDSWRSGKNNEQHTHLISKYFNKIFLYIYHRTSRSFSWDISATSTPKLQRVSWVWFVQASIFVVFKNHHLRFDFIFLFRAFGRIGLKVFWRYVARRTGL